MDGPIRPTNRAIWLIFRKRGLEWGMAKIKNAAPPFAKKGDKCPMPKGKPVAAKKAKTPKKGGKKAMNMGGYAGTM